MLLRELPTRPIDPLRPTLTALPLLRLLLTVTVPKPEGLPTLPIGCLGTPVNTVMRGAGL